MTFGVSERACGAAINIIVIDEGLPANTQLRRRLEDLGASVGVVTGLSALSGPMLRALELASISSVAIEPLRPHQAAFMDRVKAMEAMGVTVRLPSSRAPAQFKHLARCRERRERRASAKGKGG